MDVVKNTSLGRCTKSKANFERAPSKIDRHVFAFCRLVHFSKSGCQH